MESIFAVFYSDAVSRDGTWFSLTVLEDILWQTTPAGVPSNFGHDSHRPAGWAQPTGLYFQPGLVRSTGLLLLPETAEEDQLIRERHAQAWAQRQQESAAPYLDDLRGEMQGRMTDVAQFLTGEALACLEPNLAERVFSELGVNLDKVGLVYLPELLKTFTYKSHGVFQHKKRPLLVFVHSYFRRSLSRANNFHWAFLNELLQQAANPNILVRLKLDGTWWATRPPSWSRWSTSTGTGRSSTTILPTSPTGLPGTLPRTTNTAFTAFSARNSSGRPEKSRFR